MKLPTNSLSKLESTNDYRTQGRWWAVQVVLLVCALFAVALLAPTAFAQKDSTAPRPNVLFIAIDDLNNYALGLNSDAAARTPHLEALARRGTLFTNAHCAAPACNPSRAAVMTGLAPSTSGVYLNSQDWRDCGRFADVVTLPQHFRNHGYHVMGGGKLYHASNLRASQLEGYLDSRPWHEYFPSRSRQLADEVTPPRQTVNGSNEFYGGRFDWDALDIADDEMGDGQVVSWAERQLSKSHDKPLFLGVGIYRPHIPWYTPEEWFAKYSADEIKLPPRTESDLNDVPDAGVNMARQPWQQWLADNDKWRAATHAYLASVSFADAMVGRLVKALDEGPLANNTIVVLWSDHGYHLGHKRHWEKFALWRQATHVPMIVVDRRYADSGGRCNRPVSLLDLYPTLSELCRLETPEHLAGAGLDGKSLAGASLVPFLKNANAPSDRTVVVTHGKDNHAAQSEHWRYIRYYDGSEELYDHRQDPGEATNLAGRPENNGIIRRLARQLPVTNAPANPPIQLGKDRFVVSLPHEKQIAAFSISGHNHLTRESQTTLEASPGASVFDSSGKTLYVATTAPNTIAVLAANGKVLRQIQSVTVPAKPSFLELTPAGDYLVAAYYRTGQVTVHRVTESGRLSGQPIQILDVKDRAHAVAIDRSGQFVFIPHTTPNAISQLRFDTMGTGKLVANDPPAVIRKPKTGPRHLRFHPTANFAYGSNEQGCSISLYALDPRNGTLSHQQTVSSLPGSYQGEATTSDVEVHPSGRFAYIANRKHGSIAAFAIDENSGRLTLLQTISTESIPRSFNISPTGKFLLVGGQRSGELVVYRIGQDGKLKRTTDWKAGRSVNWISSYPIR